MKILAHEDACEMVVGNVRVISEGRGSIRQNPDDTFTISDDYMPAMRQGSPRRCTCDPDIFDLDTFRSGGSA